MSAVKCVRFSSLRQSIREVSVHSIYFSAIPTRITLQRRYGGGCESAGAIGRIVRHLSTSHPDLSTSHPDRSGVMLVDLQLTEYDLVSLQVADRLGVETFCWDPCGIIMAGGTWFLVLWAVKRGHHYVDYHRFSDVALFAVVRDLVHLLPDARLRALSILTHCALRPPRSNCSTTALRYSH